MLAAPLLRSGAPTPSGSGGRSLRGGRPPGAEAVGLDEILGDLSLRPSAAVTLERVTERVRAPAPGGGVRGDLVDQEDDCFEAYETRSGTCELRERGSRCWRQGTTTPRCSRGRSAG